jgi:hypothetical protein
VHGALTQLIPWMRGVFDVVSELVTLVLIS